MFMICPDEHTGWDRCQLGASNARTANHNREMALFMATIIKSNKCDPARQLSQDRVLLSVVVPCFNEQEVIERTYTELVRRLGYLEGIALQIVIVDDGSTDRTGEIVKDLMTKDESIKLVRFLAQFRPPGCDRGRPRAFSW